MTAGRIFVIGSSALVAAVVVMGIYLTGSPRQARIRSLDHQRIQALTQLSNAINSYRYDHQALPQSLDAAAQAQPGISPADLRDPATNTRYEYRPGGADSYQLCAVFDGPAAPDEDIRWRHGKGRTCFEFTAAPPRRPI